MRKLYRVFIPTWARANFKGRARVARRFDSEANAEVWIGQVKTRLKAIRAGGELASLGAKVNTTTFRLAAWSWFDQCEIRPATRAWYKGYLERRLIPALGALQVSQVSQSVLADYRRKRSKAKAGARTIQAEIAVVHRVLRWARTAGYAIDDTAFRVEAPEVRVEVMRRYDPQVVDQLLAAAAAGPKPSRKKRGRKDPMALAKVAKRDVLVVEILRRLGLRAGELRAMRVEWIRFGERRLVVPHHQDYSPKGGAHRSIPIEADLLALLKDWIGDRTTGTVMAPERPGRPAVKGEKRKPHHRGKGIDVNRLMARVAKQAKLEITAHDLRHYAISRWVDLMPAGGWSLADIQQWAGHASIRTTELYLHQAGGRWRSHAQALDRAASGSDTGSGSSEGHLRVVR